MVKQTSGRSSCSAPDSPGDQLLQAAVSNPIASGGKSKNFYLGTPEGDYGAMSESEGSSIPESMNTGVSAITPGDMLALRKSFLKISRAEAMADMYDSKA